MTDLQLDGRALRAADHRDGALDGPALGRDAVDLEDLVAGLQPRGLRGRVGQRTHDHDEVVDRLDRRADALEGAGELVARDRVGLGGDVRRVRVVEGVEDAVDRALVEVLQVDAVGLDEVVLEHLQDLAEQIEVDVVGARGGGCGAAAGSVVGGQHRAVALRGDASEEADGDEQHGDHHGQRADRGVANRVAVHRQLSPPDPAAPSAVGVSDADYFIMRPLPERNAANPDHRVAPVRGARMATR